MRALPFVIALLGLLVASCAPRQEARPPLVLAASSLQEALSDAADAWARRGHERPVLSFAASSALARQIERGAAADLFIPADEQWMNALERGGHIRRRTRQDLVANGLVLVAPAAAETTTLGWYELVGALGEGRLAMADPDAVPSGRYGKASLESLGIWTSVADRIAVAENVRAALAMVERGQVPLGIVYATDARASARVKVVARLPEGTHPPILYPAAILAASTSADAEGFRQFLFSDAGLAIFARHGFSLPPRR